MEVATRMARTEMGVPEIDAGHEKIACILERVATVAQAGDPGRMLEALGELKTASETHFRVEEEWMAAINYGGLAEHKILHDNEIARISDLMGRITGGGMRPSPRQTLPFAIWFREHLRTADLDLAEAIRSHRRKAGAPAAGAVTRGRGPDAGR